VGEGVGGTWFPESGVIIVTSWFLVVFPVVLTWSVLIRA